MAVPAGYLAAVSFSVWERAAPSYRTLRAFRAA